MSGTTERICAKFTGKTSLVRRSDEFECQGQRSKVNVTRDKKCAVHSHHPRQERMVRFAAWRTVTRLLQTTSLSSRRDHSVAAGGDFSGLRTVYVW